MEIVERKQTARELTSPLDMSPAEFRVLGYGLVDRIASFLASLPERSVTPHESPHAVRAKLGAASSLPEIGTDPKRLLEEATDLLFDHSLLNGHPCFWGFITSSAAPIGALGDLLAAAVNPNVGGWILSPMASEIEAQTVRWIAELIGYPTTCGGLLVSGGNMANFTGFITARKTKAPWDVRVVGMGDGRSGRMLVYTSVETHTWIHKAADLFGLGTDSIRWIRTDERLRLDTSALRKQIQEDKENGDLPFLVVGTAGSVSTGAIDPLPELASICQEYKLWFHVDGAYGGFAAALPNAPEDLQGLSLADSVAIDPHKWLYVPLEAGCVLVRDPLALREAFSYHPPYYFSGVDEQEEPFNYHEYGPQNSRGFRALKVWLGLRQVGREGYVRMIAKDIHLAQELFRFVKAHPDLEPFTQSLSVTTFRYVPPDLRTGTETNAAYLNQLNMELLTRLQNSGEAFLSNAVIAGTFVLRVCVVNFRTTLDDIQTLPGIVTRIGQEVDREIRPEELRNKL